MNSKSLFWLLIMVLLTTVPLAQAQQPGKIFRIGFLDPSTASGSGARVCVSTGAAPSRMDRGNEYKRRLPILG